MHVKFWGVRGSIAVSGAAFARTGGNTTCVEVTHAGHRLILDGGTGLRALGAAHGFAPMRAHLLFTHLHWDHIQGVPFFTPALHPDSALTFVGPQRDTGSLQEALAVQMRPPQFPITLDRLVGARTFRDVRLDRPFDVGPFKVTPLDQQHPDGVVVYRIEAGGKALLFATDTEHGGGRDRRFLALAEGVDLLVQDAQYTWAEYSGESGPGRAGWGHSAWEEAVALAQAAQVKRLALFHHDPTRDDAGVDSLESLARLEFPRTFAAREGMGVAL
ncbi:MAG: MBL fold metallo-hydrolase [Myxococcales bacterium]|nr:MBL fold metallo-hydrolase [Myxococcales bacterium]MCB9521878.1 MBL fold metallo-hydrolase [Myxococcales bacterium]